MNIEQRVEKGLSYHKLGYNCAQCVIAAYIDDFNLDEETMMKATYGFGAGMGATGELCGCLSGAGVLFGMKHGTKEANPKLKMEINKKVASLIEDFRNEFDEVRCSALKEFRKATTNPKYKTCNGYIEETIRLLEKYMTE